MNYDPLIFGKDQTERIVSLEVQDDQLILFKELEDGSIETEYRENKFWLLLTTKEHESFKRLEGDQPYKWLYTCDNREKYLLMRNKCYKKRLDFYSIFNPKESAMVMNGITYFKGMKISDVSILSFDIETDGLKKTDESEVYCITNTFRKLGKTIRKGFFLDDFKGNQADMILAWCKWVREVNPSIVLGHNILLYDFPYLRHVCDLHGITMDLGRDGSEIVFEDRKSKFRKDGSQEYEFHNTWIFGREVVDTWMLSIKFDIGRNFTSYGLKSIVNQLGLEKKDRTFIDAGKIKHYFYNNKAMWEKVKLYAEEDSDDSIKLYDIMIPSTFYFTQSVSKPFQMMILSATGSQINNLMCRSYLQVNHSISRADETSSFEGAISFGIPGLYKNCVRWDVSSLYPSIMRQFKVYNNKKDINENFIKLTNYFALERLKNKKLAKETGEKYYQDLEQSQKVGANSLFGFLAAPGLNYNYPDGASFITKKGREFLTKAVKWASGKTLEEIGYNEDKDDNND